MRGRQLGGLLAALALAGCSATAEGGAGTEYHPAVVEAVPGADVWRVTLTDDAADRIGLELGQVTRTADTTSIPYAALIYDGQGAAWVYVEDTPLSFVRRAVDVRRVEGRRVVVDEGLADGARVAMTGATELYGAELGIDGSH
ncbi:hypothetical protein [uncultured Phycicoccus sp.]|uniref:hypothetical protein n=1 Tax=uncultured Phycicoccus sp. TaxID=661422 RepID=UPI002602E448|nr:hypothetical protein [uncultured Phycicoccus sp.]